MVLCLFALLVASSRSGLTLATVVLAFHNVPAADAAPKGKHKQFDMRKFAGLVPFCATDTSTVTQIATAAATTAIAAVGIHKSRPRSPLREGPSKTSASSSANVSTATFVDPSIARLRAEDERSAIEQAEAERLSRMRGPAIWKSSDIGKRRFSEESLTGLCETLQAASKKTGVSTAGIEADLFGVDTRGVLRDKAPKVYQRKRGNFVKAMAIGRNAAARDRAREDFTEDMYAKSSDAARRSKLATIETLANRSVPPIEINPVSPNGLLELAALFKAAGYRSGDTYLGILKTESIGRGHPWTEQHELANKRAVRSLTRGLGPTKKAEVFGV